MPKFAIEKDATIKDRRFGSRIDIFHENLSEMEVGDSFVIPCKPRVVKGKQVMSPEYGFNVKAVNEQYKPKTFKKVRVYKGERIGETERSEPSDGIRVFRLS